jgi:hypothetical protein
VVAGASRHEIAVTLKTAYSDGLLSEDTFAQRIDQLLSARLVDPLRLLGDLGARRPLGTLVRRVPGLAGVVRRLQRRDAVDEPSSLLALDWSGADAELTIGRHFGCDIVLANQTVSRHHACLTYRDGVWVLHDLQSTNGTTVNGSSVTHCVLHPGDDLVLGDERLKVD